MHGTGDPEYLGWPGRVCAATGRARVTMYNLGVRGDTSEDVRVRWRDEVSRRLPADFPGAIVFGFGLNDTLISDAGTPRVDPRRTLDNAREILTAALRHWPVLVVGPAPVDDSRLPPQVPGPTRTTWATSNRHIGELNQAMRTLAGELGAPYLDLFDALSHDAAWIATLAESDPVHPVAAYGSIAARFRRWPAWVSLLGGETLEA